MIETIAEAILSSRTKFKDDLGCPDKPGLYAFVLREKGDLGEYGKPGQVIYVGSAPDSLAKGNWNADLKDGKTGASVLRRSIGAILKEQLKATAFSRNGTVANTALDHFKFDSKSEKAITLWMKENLEFGWWAYNEAEAAGSNLANLEKALNIHFKPTLDLSERTRQRNPLTPKLTALWQECKDEAKMNCITELAYF